VVIHEVLINAIAPKLVKNKVVRRTNPSRTTLWIERHLTYYCLSNRERWYEPSNS